MIKMKSSIVDMVRTQEPSLGGGGEGGHGFISVSGWQSLSSCRMSIKLFTKNKTKKLLYFLRPELLVYVLTTSQFSFSSKLHYIVCSFYLCLPILFINLFKFIGITNIFALVSGTHIYSHPLAFYLSIIVSIFQNTLHCCNCTQDKWCSGQQVQLLCLSLAVSSPATCNSR